MGAPTILEPEEVFLKRTQTVHPDDAAAPAAAAPEADVLAGKPRRRRGWLARLFSGGRGR